MRLIFSLLLFLLLSAKAFADDALNIRAKTLFQDIRCATCQSQTIESSNAKVAQDMRAFILKRLEEGADDTSIRNELRVAYGDAIFLTPPVQKNTYLLWALPFLILVGGVAALSRHLKQGAQT